MQCLRSICNRSGVIVDNRLVERVSQQAEPRQFIWRFACNFCLAMVTHGFDSLLDQWLSRFDYAQYCPFHLRTLVHL